MEAERSLGHLDEYVAGIEDADLIDQCADLIFLYNRALGSNTSLAWREVTSAAERIEKEIDRLTAPPPEKIAPSFKSSLILGTLSIIELLLPKKLS